MQIQSKYDVVIIGGGVYGLTIAYYLSKNEDLKIALLQQYSIGHNKGSSHSTTRIIRSLYEKQVYRDLNLQGLTKNWPEMEKVLGQKFVHQNEFIYFDDDQQSYNNFRKVAEAFSQENVKICQDFDQYNQYFKGKKAPQIASKYPPIIDKTAGVIYASLYIKKLQEYLSNNCENVALMEHTFVKSISENKKELSIETQTEILRANKVVLACGHWIKELIPQTISLFHVVKQFVSFLELEPQKEFVVGKYPSFAHNTKFNKLFYSIPCDKTQRLGVKLAQHRFSQPQNPNFPENTSDYQYEKLRQKALQYFGEDLVRVKTIEECIYTNTKSNDFIIDWVGQSQKILICSCCSGHGFKFAPIIGEIVSQIVDGNGEDGEHKEGSNDENGKNEKQEGNKVRKVNETYKKWQHMFKIAYHKGVDLS